MRLILQQKNNTWRMSDVDETHLALLRQAGEDASMTDCPEGRARLFPKPVSSVDEILEAELMEDWKDYVTEDMDTQFSSDVGTLLSDLDTAKRVDPLNAAEPTEDDEEESKDDEDEDDEDEDDDDNEGPIPSGPDEVIYQLEVPLDHGQAWFSALNQARIMLDIKYKLHPDGREFEPDEALESLGDVDSYERLGAYMRYEFYAIIQEWLVRHTL